MKCCWNIQSWAGQGKGLRWSIRGDSPVHSNSLLSQRRRECSLLMTPSTERQISPLTPRPWGRELGVEKRGGGISWDFLSFQTCRVLTYTDRKKHLLNRSAYIKDNKSDMIDESAWPVTKPATAPTRGPIAPFYFFNIFYFYELYESLRCRSSMSWIKPFCMFYTHTHMQQNGLHLCIHIKSASM